MRAGAGQVCVLITDPDFASYLGTAFGQVRANAQAALAIYLRLFEALGTVAVQCPAGASRAALGQQANLTVPYDLDQVYKRCRELQAQLLGL